MVTKDLKYRCNTFIVWKRVFNAFIVWKRAAWTFCLSFPQRTKGSFLATSIIHPVIHPVLILPLCWSLANRTWTSAPNGKTIEQSWRHRTCVYTHTHTHRKLSSAQQKPDTNSTQIRYKSDKHPPTHEKSLFTSSCVVWAFVSTRKVQITDRKVGFKNTVPLF